MARRKSPRILMGGIAALACLMLAALAVLFMRSPIFLALRDPQRTAYEQLKRASEQLPELYFQEGFPRGALVRVRAEGADPVERAIAYLETYAELYLQSDPNLRLEVRRTAGPEGEDVIFYQTYKSLPVHAAELTVTVSGDYVYGSAGGLLPAGVDLNTVPTLNAAEAEDIARADVGFPQAPIFGQTQLVVFDRSLFDSVESEPHLVWRVTLGDEEQWRSFVDAHDGAVILRTSLEKAHTGGYELDLENANGANAADTNCYWDTTDDDEIGDEDGVYEEAQGDPEAQAAWNVSWMTWYFYHDTFGRHSYDDDEGEVEVYIHSSNAGGANWTPGSIDCDLIQFNTGWVAFDVMVHEFTHGVITFTSDLQGMNQPGALAESYSDIMGAVADGNWLVGEDVVGPTLRSISNPSGSSFGDPDHMANIVITGADNGGVHTNNGIPNKAAFLIAAGGTHPLSGVDVAGIGTGNMANLFYATMTALPTNAQFIDARNLTVAQAQAHGYSAHTICQIRNAYFAVGLGNPDIDCDGQEDDPDQDGDGVPFGQDNCEGPFGFNPAQVDADGDGIGTPCDPDDNGNGIWDGFEPYMKECPNGSFIPAWLPCNPDDVDDDGIDNDDDNCPEHPNPGQEDVDNDGFGDACDPDEDADGWSNDDDNCPFTHNPDQANVDGDFAGDACDPCPEVYDVVAWTTGALGDPVPYVPDADQDGIGDACDPSFDPAVGQVVMDGAAEPGGDSRQVDVARGDSLYLRLPVRACGLDDDPQWIDPDYRENVMLEGFPGGARVWMANEEGLAVSKARVDGENVWLPFRPQGGRAYFLTMALFNLPPGETDNFQVSLLCGLKEPPPAPSDEPTSTPAPTPTPTPTATPTPAAVLANPEFSTDVFYYESDACGPKEVTIDVRAGDPRISSVVLFYRLADADGSDRTEWTSVAMNPQGDGLYRRGLHSETDIPGFAAFGEAQLQVQIVATDAQGSEIDRTEVFSEVMLLPCAGPRIAG